MSGVGAGRLAHWLRIATGVAGRGPGERSLRRAVAGRVVLVTGASEGIGAATARKLAGAGARVILVARTEACLAQVREEILAAGGVAFVHPVDLAVPEAAAALADDVLARYGPIDVVVSNAGRSIRRSVADTADRFHDVQRLAGVNYLGPVHLLLRVLPSMRAAGHGHLVNVSTASLGLPAPMWSSYLSSKAAFDAWLRCAAPELRGDGVTVSTVYCGLVRTRMSAPTAHYRRLPAMSADEAAAVVCGAVVHRRRWSPWWSRIGVALAVIFPAAAEAAATWALRIGTATGHARALTRARLLEPGRLARIVPAVWRYGPTLAAVVAAGPPSAPALVDEQGSVSYADLDQAAAACAVAVRDGLAVRPRSRVGVVALAGRDFVAVVAGLARLGVDAVLLPPDLPARRTAEVLAGARVTAVVCGPGHRARFADQVPTLGWPANDQPHNDQPHNDQPHNDQPHNDQPVGAVRPRRLRRPGRLVVLTSGTTGTPRAVSRGLPARNLTGPLGTHLRVIPLRAGDPIVVATPIHHGYGLSYLAAGLALQAPVVLACGSTPEKILQAVAEHGAALLVVLPIQLRRLCELPDQVRDRYRLDSLRAVISGAAPLPPALCARARQVFGERVFNLYGSTEAGWAAIATPADLRAAPGTVGRPPRGVRLRLLDRDGTPVPLGQVGEIHVHGWQPDRSWTATGDLGHLDPAGRLFLDGRVDDMIISGGENVYPGPVLRALTDHPDVEDAVLTPVADHEFGQRLRATVSVRPDAVLTDQQLRDWLRDRLCPAERPRDILFVEALARTDTGKPRRRDEDGG